MDVGERMKRVRNAVDILAKHITVAWPEGALEVLGIPNVRVIRALPTELDEVVIRQQFTDVVLELEDTTILHLEFQSTRESTLYRFAAYDLALGEHFRRKIRTVVLYTGAVNSGPDSLDGGSIQYRVENVYLNRLDGDAALDTVQRHLASSEWSERDRILLAFAFHMRFAQRTQEEAFDQVIALTRKIPDEYEQNYVTALILGLSGRLLTERQQQRFKEVMRMTDIVREIEREALEKGIQQGLQQGHEKGLQEGRNEGREEVALNLLAQGVELDVIVKATGLSREKVEELQKQKQ